MSLEPPGQLPPARTLIAPGRGELFLRDTGGDGPVVMLLHGWIASADLNWRTTYSDLSDAGYRVLAIDHRGHGRGLRQLEPFRLADCAADAAAALGEPGARRSRRASGPAPPRRIPTAPPPHRSGPSRSLPPPRGTAPRCSSRWPRSRRANRLPLEVAFRPDAPRSPDRVIHSQHAAARCP